MSVNTRYVLVDDRDSAIDYTGAWSPASGDIWNSRGEFGTTYLNTLQSTTASSASFSFTFDGDAARVMGTSSVQNAKTNPNPTWQCYLDGVAQGKEPYFDGTENNWAFCKFFNLSPGRHTIRVDVESNGGPFLLDQIQYKPTTRVDNRVMMIHYTDPDLMYEGTWNEVAKTAMYAPAHGGSVTFSFIGNRISVYGMYMNQLSHSDSPASYQIDNESPVSFTVRGGGTSSAWNRLIFETPRLSQGRHTIKVTNQGGTNTTPLVFGFARVEGGTTQLVGTALSSGDSGSGGSGSSGGSSVTTLGPTSTAIASGGSITVTKIPDSDLDFDPGVDNVSDLVSQTFSTTTRTAKEGDVTVVDIQASDIAGAPSDQSSRSGTGSPSSAGASGATAKDKFPIAGIVGIVLGFFLVLALVGIFLFWRRNRRQKDRRLLETNARAFAGGGAATNCSDTLNHHAAVPAMAMYHGSAASLPVSVASLAPNRYTPSIDNSSSTASDFAAASSQSNLLQPVRKNRDASGNSVPPSEGSHSTHGEGPSQVILHEDSGLRLPTIQLSEREEVPPSYSLR